MCEPMSVTVRVPATSANLGPGFDTLGMAFSLYNTFTFERSDVNEVIGCEARFCGEDNLCLSAFRAACQAAGVEAPPIRLTIHAKVPVSRGLGSSSTLLVGGVVGACRLLSLPLTSLDMFAIVNRMEGHPDNVAPALFGGLTAAMQEDGVPFAIKHTAHPSYRFCALIPDYEMLTSEGRSVLPTVFSRADAVYNLSHATVLLSALINGDADILRVAMQDKFHQPYRAPLMKEFEDIRRMADEAGAIGLFISGSGSTLMAVYQEQTFVDRMCASVKQLTANWQVLPLQPDNEGAVCI